jgi:tRNA threonylcarbamoyladenosine biosynthesis protein TsaE
MARQTATTFQSPDDTSAFAMRLAARLTPGDTVLLVGGLGAGKTHLARSLIQSVLETPEDVPSPTFTLVQAYDTRRGPIWHADLYRIGSVDEIEELGLVDAFDAAICLVEWPDRLGQATPADALTLALAQSDDENARTLTASWTDDRWTQTLQDLMQ